MENDKTEAEFVAATVNPEILEPKAEKSERKESDLRESIKRNIKETDEPTKATHGTQTEPAANKSFVNGEAQQVAKPQEMVAAPASMNAEEKKVWETLPVEAKKFLSRRDYETRSHFTKQTEGLSQKEREVSDVLGAVTPEIREEYTRQGIAIPDLVRRSIAWDKRVKEGIDGALEFLEAHGYKAEDLTGYKSPEPEAPQYLTREEAEALAEQKLEEKFKYIEESRVVEQNAMALQSYLDTHSVFKGDPGTAAQFETAVAEEIEYLKYKGFQGSTVELLSKAHERAIQNNEAFSSLRPQAAPQVTAKPENIYEQMERVRLAKAASKSANGSLGSGSPMHKSNSLRESLERNAARSG